MQPGEKMQDKAEPQAAESSDVWLDEKRHGWAEPQAAESRVHIKGGADYETADYKTAKPGQPARPEHGRWEENRTNEDFFLNHDRDCFAVYQIDRNGKGRAYCYMGTKAMQKYQLSIKREDYQMVYCDALKEQDTLDSLFEKFNLAHPNEFSGFSMCVSDVVAFNQDGKVKTYFVDSFGFTELRGFLHQAEREPIRQEPKKISTKQSVLEALRNRQARLKRQEKKQETGAMAKKRKGQEL